MKPDGLERRSTFVYMINFTNIPVGRWVRSVSFITGLFLSKLASKLLLRKKIGTFDHWLGKIYPLQDVCTGLSANQYDNKICDMNCSKQIWVEYFADRNSGDSTFSYYFAKAYVHRVSREYGSTRTLHLSQQWEHIQDF